MHSFVSLTVLNLNNLEPYLRNSTQLIVANATDWNSHQAKMQWFERASVNDKWQPYNEPFDVVIGKKGLAYGQSQIPVPEGIIDFKKEGDMKSPAGLFGFCFAFGYAKEPDPVINWPYLHIDENFVGVDDPDSRYYNCIVDQSKLKPQDWKSAETMYRSDGLYKWGMVIDYNFNPFVKSGGSQIFLHIWRGPESGTEGCTAMPENKMLELLQWLDGKRNPLLWQGVNISI